jgi:carbonic anhydrase
MDHSDVNALLAGNREWAASMTAAEPTFFTELARAQRPAYLWIGCSDSRVPANQIVGLPPGGVFVHRNIGNVVVHTDLNCLSVIQYAVDVLHVRHVIVTGHYGCGAIAAALEGGSLGLIDNWLRHIQDVAADHRAELEARTDASDRADRLSELNVAAQASNVCRTTIVQDAWRRGQELAVHGWIYRLSDGLLRDLQVTATGPDPASHESIAP